MIHIRKRILILGLALALSLNQFAYGNILDNIIETNNEDLNENEETEESEEINLALSDIEGHWAESRIEEAIKLGFVSGYNDGTFRPDRTITRAEFATLLNNAMKIESSVEINLSDVYPSDWYYNEVEKSVAVGFFSGYENNTFRPNNPITRQEAAKVITGAITTGNLDGDGAINLKDYASIQEWAKESVNLAYNKSYIMGYPDKSYAPNRSLTRAEAVKIIYEILDNENIEHGFNITNYNESYSGAVVVGDLDILNSVGNSNINLTNVTVLGNINILAENPNSITLTDVRARDIIIENNSSVNIIYNNNVIINDVNMPVSQ